LPAIGAASPVMPGRDRPDTLELIASWQCPGNIDTGGGLHAWDLNANGVTDLVYSNWRYTTYAYEAIGDNLFQQVHQVANPVGSYYTTLVCAGDGDSDGRAELVYSSGTSGVPRNLYILESRRPDSYPDSLCAVVPEVNIGVNHMRAGDLDGDGLREYIGSTQGTHDRSVAIWECRGDNSYAQVYSVHFGPGYSVSGEIAVGDFDRDGRGDLVVPEIDGARIIHVIESTGNDQYQEVWSEVVPTENMFWVTPGPDLDRDGLRDFVVEGGSGIGQVIWSIIMYEETGPNAYAPVWSQQVIGGWINGGLATGDADGDGWNELLVQVGGLTQLYSAVADNDLELTWSLAGPLIGQGEHRIIAPDLDGDLMGEAIWWTTENPGTLVLYERIGLPPALVDESPATSLLLTCSPALSRGVVSLRYCLSRPSRARLDAFDVLGRRVACLLDAEQGAGEHAFAWRTGTLPAGVYACRLSTGQGTETRRVIVAR